METLGRSLSTPALRPLQPVAAASQARPSHHLPTVSACPAACPHKLKGDPCHLSGPLSLRSSPWRAWPLDTTSARPRVWHEGNGATPGLTLPVFLGGAGATQGLLEAGGLRGSGRAVKALEGHGVGLQRSRILPPRPHSGMQCCYVTPELCYV